MSTQMNDPTARPEVRLHTNLTVLEADTPEQLEELRALPEVRRAVVRVLDDRRAVLDPSRLEPMLAALERHGSIPRLTDDHRDEG